MTEFSSQAMVIDARPRTSDELPVDGDPGGREVPYLERIWEWLLRFVLPITLGLCVQSIIWMWFSSPYALDTWSIGGGIVLLIVTLLIAIWTWHSWLPFDRELLLKPTTWHLHFRHVVLALVALALVGGFASLNAGGGPPQASAHIAARA